MPIFKISQALKQADRDINDSTARCIDCEYPAEKGNSLMPLGRTPDGSRDLVGRENCSSYQDRLKEQQELESREQNGVFAPLTKFRAVAKNMPDNSTVEATFPMLTDAQEVGNITNKQVDANYVDGAPVPPKN